MTITAPTKQLRDALAKLQPITSSKSSLPALGAVTIQQGRGLLNLSGTNLDQWMTISIQGADMEDPEFSVSSKDLYDILRLTDDEEVFLKVTEKLCTIGDSRMPLVIDPLPVLPEADWSEPFVIDGLPGLLAKCIPFASTDPNRYILNSVYFSKLGLVSASNYGLIKIDAPVPAEANVPVTACALVAKEEGEVSVRFSASLAEFSGEGWILTTKCIEGADGSKYMNVGLLLRNKILHSLTCNRVEAIKAAAFAALPLPVLIDSVSAESGGDTLRFFTPASNENHRSRTIEAQCEQNHSWGVSARKLAMLLGAFDSKMVTMGFTDVQQAVIEEGNTFAMLMLCRVG